MQFEDIPDFNRYQLTECGTLRVKETGIIHTGSTNPKGYMNYRLKHDDGYTITIGRHRLLMLTFRPCENSEELIVNHLNGIKGDDRLDNLEWCTYVENIEHAGLHGLTTKCKPVDLYDHNTGEIIQFPSIVKASRHTGVTKDTIIWRLKYASSEIWEGQWSYRYHVKSPWIDFESNRKVHEKPLVVCDVRTSQEKIYTNRSEFAKEHGISTAAITSYFKQMQQPTLPHYLRLKNVGEDWLPLDDYFKSVIDLTGIKIVVVKGKGVQHYFGLKECAHANNLNITTLHYRLSKKSGVVCEDGKSYEYYS